jgi:hypothetical protein
MDEAAVVTPREDDTPRGGIWRSSSGIGIFQNHRRDGSPLDPGILGSDLITYVCEDRILIAGQEEATDHRQDPKESGKNVQLIPHRSPLKNDTGQRG